MGDRHHHQLVDEIVYFLRTSALTFRRVASLDSEFDVLVVHILFLTLHAVFILVGGNFGTSRGDKLPSFDVVTLECLVVLAGLHGSMVDNMVFNIIRFRVILYMLVLLENHILLKLLLILQNIVVGLLKTFEEQTETHLSLV
jgi:hypothetical protein